MVGKLGVVAVSLAAGQSVAAESPATGWAREEFADYAAKVFGEAPAVAFVLPGETADFADDFDALKGTDGYAVRFRDGKLVFVADCPKGHVNGVHRWLEKNSDIIWPRPKGDLCFYTPRSPRTFPAADYRDVPAFRLRFFGGGAADDETRRYLARNAVSPTASLTNLDREKNDRPWRYGTVGAYCDVYGGGHDMETRWFPRAEFLEAHPEYYMLVDGKRGAAKRTNFCETNPAFVEAYAKSVEEKIRNLPDSVRIISINMEDTSVTCQCPDCLKPLHLPDGTVIEPKDPAFRSTRFFLFFNAVARHVAKIRPDLRILQFAYMHLAIPPKVKVERNVILKFCPYPRNMREGVIRGASNAKWRARIDEWLVNTPEMYWREYYFCGNIYFPRPMADTAADDLRYIASRGIRYVYTDSPGRYGDTGRNNAAYSLNRPYHEFYDMNGMEAWVVQKLFWDPSQDPEALRAEFCRRTFGPAAADVAEFHRLIRTSWNSDNLASGFRDNPFRSAAHYIVANGISEKCRAALASAAAKADNAGRADWIAAMRKTFEDWIADAPNWVCPVQKVPFVQSDAGGIRLPSLKSLKDPKKLDPHAGTSVTVRSDGRAFVFDFDIDKAGKRIQVRRDLPKGVFPSGDKVELSFALKKGGYVHLAFDAEGQTYTGKADAAASCDWTATVGRTAAGWKATARVPFEALDFAPQVDPEIRVNVMITYAASQKYAHSYSLGAGQPHVPAGWTVMNVEVNSEK